MKAETRNAERGTGNEGGGAEREARNAKHVRELEPAVRLMTEAVAHLEGAIDVWPDVDLKGLTEKVVRFLASARRELDSRRIAAAMMEDERKRAAADPQSPPPERWPLGPLGPLDMGPTPPGGTVFGCLRDRDAIGVGPLEVRQDSRYLIVRLFGQDVIRLYLGAVAHPEFRFTARKVRGWYPSLHRAGNGESKV